MTCVRAQKKGNAKTLRANGGLGNRCLRLLSSGCS
jgi:hypothetical protein